MKYQLLPINKIRPDKDQPRQTINTEEVKGLAQSFKTVGVINAIEVDEKYVIITGEMRWRAAKLAGLKEVPCKILKVDPKQRFLRQVIENIHHNTMNAYEEGKAFAKLLNLPPSGRSAGKDAGISRLARQIGKDPNYVMERLDRLVDSKAIQQALKEKRITFTHARELKKVPKEFRAEMEKKMLAGEFQKSNSVTEVLTALSRNPEKAKEILAINYKPLTHTVEVIEVVSKISPRLPDLVRSRLAPRQEFTRIKNELLDWLVENPPHGTIQFDRGYLILALSQIVEKINEWGRVANLPQLQGNSDEHRS